MRLNFFINWSYDSFVIVLPNTSFQSVEERIFLKFSTDTLFTVRVDIFVFGHWLCILEFKIVNIGKWSLMSSLILVHNSVCQNMIYCSSTGPCDSRWSVNNRENSVFKRQIEKVFDGCTRNVVQGIEV